MRSLHSMIRLFSAFLPIATLTMLLTSREQASHRHVFYFKNVPVEFLVLFVHLNYLLQQNVCNIFNSFSFLRQTSQDNPDVKSSMKTDLIQFLQSYASPITLSALGFIVPSMFFFFSGLEDWNPRVRVNVDLARYVTRALQGKRTCKGGCFQIWRVYNARMKHA